MNKGMPAIWENVAELREMIRNEKDGLDRTKLQMLLMLRSNARRRRNEAAACLGVHRKTVGDWMRKYEQGGLTKLLEKKSKGGSQSSLPLEVIEGMRKQLAEPSGFSSYKHLLAWVMKTFSITTTFWVVYYTATKILNARPAVARKSNIKKKRVMKKPLNPALNSEFDMQR
jgi:transposase